MTWLWTAIWNAVPLWVWIGCGVVAAVVAYRFLGWKGLLAVAAVTFGAAAYGRGVKTGVTSEREKQAKADRDAAVIIGRERSETEIMDEAQLDKEMERWSRKP